MAQTHLDVIRIRLLAGFTQVGMMETRMIEGE